MDKRQENELNLPGASIEEGRWIFFDVDRVLERRMCVQCFINMKHTTL